MAAYENKSVQRHMIADFLNVGTGETEKWVLMGTGFTSLDENPNAQTKESRYINSPSSSKTTTGYQPQFPFNAEFIKSEEAIAKLYEIARDRKTGGDAEVDYIRVDLYEDVLDGAYPARKFRCSVEVSSIADSDGTVSISGNLNNYGNFTAGTFNVTTKTFTED